MNAVTIADTPRFKRMQVRATILEVRSRRRRRGIMWAILAACALLSSWDLTSRLDEVAYNAALSRTQ